MSSNGIKTSFWGPHAWAFLFSTIAGSYPIRVDKNNRDHIKTMRGFQNMLKSLENTLPCVYCRQSYGKFIREVPLSKYEHSRQEMLKWLYIIHDKVNKKLIKQERDLYETEKKRLAALKVKPDRMKVQLSKFKSKTFKTKPSPSFEKVLAMYEKQRAGCDKKTKRCM